MQHIEAHFMMVFLRHSETEKPKRENEREMRALHIYISYIFIHSVHYDCSRTSNVGVGMQSLRVRAHACANVPAKVSTLQLPGLVLARCTVIRFQSLCLITSKIQIPSLPEKRQLGNLFVVLGMNQL